MAGTSWGPFFAANDIKSKHVKLPCPGPLHGLWGGRKDELSGLMSPLSASLVWFLQQQLRRVLRIS